MLYYFSTHPIRDTMQSTMPATTLAHAGGQLWQQLEAVTLGTRSCHPGGRREFDFFILLSSILFLPLTAKSISLVTKITFHWSP
jgi:hypothetical protein